MIMKQKKGQMTMIGLLMGLVSIITFVALLPIIEYWVEVGVNATDSTTIALLLNLYPLFMALGVLIAIVSYLTFVRAQ